MLILHGAVLERLGDLPDWQGARKLRESLEPVYDAASPYALEYVLAEKPGPCRLS